MSADCIGTGCKAESLMTQTAANAIRELRADLAAMEAERSQLLKELMEWQTAYIAEKKLLDDMREAVVVAYEALRFAWGGEPIGSLEMEAMQKMGAGLRALTELNATEPRKP